MRMAMGVGHPAPPSQVLSAVWAGPQRDRALVLPRPDRRYFLTALVDFLAGAFAGAVLAAAFLTGAFLTGAFLAGAFLAGALAAVAFLAGVFSADAAFDVAFLAGARVDAAAVFDVAFPPAGAFVAG